MPASTSRRLSIGQRLALGFAVILAMMVVLTLIGVNRVGVIRNSLVAINEAHSVKQRQAINFRGSVHDRAIALRDVVLARSAVEQQAALAEIQRLADRYAEAQRVLDGLLQKSSGVQQKERELAAAIREVEQRTLPLANAVIAAERNGRPDEARTLLLEQAAPAFSDWLASINAFIDLQEGEIRRDSQTATAIAYSFSWLMIVLCSAALLCGVLLAVLITRRLLAQLGAEPDEVRELAAAIGRGELAVGGQPRGHTDSILAALLAMAAQLQDTVARVRQAADAVSVGSTQISRHGDELSERSEQQVSALTATAAAMEELGATVHLNADNARQADQLAASAASVASRGGELMQAVVTTMGDINSRSRQVADIVTIIDGIAFQTNILALNASVEAARAGEEGRGFAVVANEVRHLAQRSAEAAKDIKALIGETLQSVERGAGLVDDAGHTTAEIVTAIARVSQIMSEISTASREQSMAVEQVSRAVVDMDRTTQINRQLVTDSAQAAHSLQQQAEALAAAMAVFRLDSHAGAPPIPDTAALPAAPAARVPSLAF
ncbi:methyl-accepting chemotaxis protein [Pseudomonas oryzae]|uniref:Methyl-accepting chemotaxis protein n=2 Tax=Pseudomonas oryzae TaxID=1392877 RepID=A0A1H1XSS8_9PSED|nr:methyl-accepting chemotaxis protein [Pseudomonas oryzae]SDT12253.1 methyl-accepting chemotaxis protein [Pseudomonas oryzae]